MAEETILTWNITNWITVVVMVMLGFAILALGAQLWRNWQGSPPSSPISSVMPSMGG